MKFTDVDQHHALSDCGRYTITNIRKHGDDRPWHEAWRKANGIKTKDGTYAMAVPLLQSRSFDRCVAACVRDDLSDSMVNPWPRGRGSRREGSVRV